MGDQAGHRNQHDDSECLQRKPAFVAGTAALSIAIVHCTFLSPPRAVARAGIGGQPRAPFIRPKTDSGAQAASRLLDWREYIRRAMPSQAPISVISSYELKIYKVGVSLHVNCPIDLENKVYGVHGSW